MNIFKRVMDITEATDLPKYCRICLGLLTPTSCFDINDICEEEENITYNECLIICTGIDLTLTDNFARRLCKICSLQLQMTFSFLKKLEKSQRKVKEILNKGKKIGTSENIPPNEVHVNHLCESNVLEDEGQIENSEGDLVIEILYSDDDKDEMLEEHLYNEEYQEILSLDEVQESFDELSKPDIENDNVLEEYKQTKIDEKPESEETDSQINNDVSSSKQVKVENLLPEITINKIKRIKIKTSPPFKCEQCNHLSPTRALLASHRYRKHRIKENPFYCPKCNKACNTRIQLERHLNRPTCDVYPKFKCEFCDKVCIGVSNYNIHLRFHKKQYPFVCHQCGKVFMISTHLTSHIKSKHENQRYFCEYPNCNKKFQTLYTLKLHSYLHLKQMPFKCEYCEKSFPSRGTLRRHIIKNHNIEVSLQELTRMQVKCEVSENANGESIEKLNEVGQADESE